MGIEITDVADQEGFSKIEDGASRLIFLPTNFESSSEENIHFASTLPTVLKLAKKEGLSVGVFSNPSSPTLLEQRSFEWFAPAMFISSLYYSSNPDAVSIALNMLSSYLTTIFSGSPSKDGIVSLNMYAKNEKTGRTKRIAYKGPASGLKDVDNAINSFFKNGQ